MMTKGQEYTERGKDHDKERDRQRVLLNLKRRAQQLGMPLVSDTAAPQPA